MEFQTGAHVQM